jgi:hypothetical protein
VDVFYLGLENKQKHRKGNINMYSLSRCRSVTLESYDMDYDIELEDVEDFIFYCPEDMLTQLQEAISERRPSPKPAKFGSLEEELKYDMYLRLSENMSLDELEKRLSK